MALLTEHIKENRNGNQQNANWALIVNTSTSDEEGRSIYLYKHTAHNQAYHYRSRQFERETREAGVPSILAEALQPANIQKTI